MPTRHIDIPLRHPVFAGHFPEQPLLPGALLLDLIIASWGAPVAAVPSVKFQRPVGPGERLTLTFSPAAPGVRFACTRGAQQVCSGTLLPRPAPR